MNGECMMMRVKTLISIALVAASTVGSVWAASADTSPYERTRTLTAPATCRHKVASFVLDDDLFDHTRANYGDIRVLDADGEEVPYLPRRRVTFVTDVRERSVPLKVVSLTGLSENVIELVVEKEDEAAGDVCALTLRTGLKDFEKIVTVHGSHDGKTWTPVAKNAIIFDYTRYVSLRQTRIEIDPGAFSRYRLRISGATESQLSPLRKIMRDRRGGEVFSEQEHLTLRSRDFRIDGVAGIVMDESVRRERGVTKSYDVDALDVTTDEDTGDTLIRFDMPRVPVRKVKVETASANFVRSVVLEGAKKGENPEWTRVATTTLVSIDVGGVKRRDLSIVQQRLGRYGQYRLRIKNGDSPPLDVTSLEVIAESWEVLFFHKKGQTFRVYYGSEDVALPSYDIGNVLSRVLVSEVDAYKLGEPADNPDRGKGPPRPPVSGKTMMIIVIVAVVGVLIVLIAKASRAVEAAGEGEGD